MGPLFWNIVVESILEEYKGSSELIAFMDNLLFLIETETKYHIESKINTQKYSLKQPVDVTSSTVSPQDTDDSL